MKTIIKSCALALAIGAVSSSCYDFVNILPKDIVTEDNFWDEKKDVDQMVAGLYYKMQYDGMVRRYIVWGELRSDNLYMGHETKTCDNSVYEILRENILSNNAYTSWTDFYNIINSCNIIIERIPDVMAKDPTYTQSNANATIAEVTAIRSLMYFYLIRTFRDVPFYREAIFADEQVYDIPVSKFDYILSELISDCEAVLSSAIKVYSKEKENTGRITQNAIHALLADMYLWQGNNDKCIEHANAVILSFCQNADEKQNTIYMGGTSGAYAQLAFTAHDQDPGVQYDSLHYYCGYPLLLDQVPGASSSTFGGAFNNIFSTSGNSPETIFELLFTPEDNSAAHLANTAAGFFYGEGKTKDSNNGKGCLAPNEQLFAANNTNYLFGEFDARRYATMEVDKDGLTGFVRKYASSNNAIDPGQTNIAEHQRNVYSYSLNQNYNWIFYRLTDVMLMKAEALVEKMSDNQDDVPEEDEELRQQAMYIVYAVNNRSCMKDKDRLNVNKAGYKSKSAMQELVQAERRKELIFEGKRWFDLVRVALRSGSSIGVLNAVRGKFSGGTGGSVLPNMESLFMPYNRDEVKRNKGIDQKPYWAGLEGDETYQSTVK